MFKNFKSIKIKTSEATINTKIGGSGPPVLLMHGYPQTHFMWHKIAPILSNKFTVVLTDLRGYGDSSKPKTDHTHIAYSKKKMALDQIEVMRELGFEKFYAVGHDRGARVLHRMLIDNKESIKKAIFMDIVPTLTMYNKTDKNFAYNYYHWFFLTQPYDFPEKLIGNNPEYYLRKKIKAWGKNKNFIPKKVFDEYFRCFSNKDTIHASCEDYRASFSIDLKHDENDYGQKIKIPIFVLWGYDGFVGSNYDVISEWMEYADNVYGKGLPCGHYIPEESPEETIKCLFDFLT